MGRRVRCHHHPRSLRWGSAGGHDLLARRLPYQCPSDPHSGLGDLRARARESQRNRQRALRLDWLGDCGPVRGRARVRHHLRPATRLAGSNRLHRPHGRGSLHHRAPLLHGARAAPTHSPLALPLAQLHGHEHLDAPHLWGALRHVLLPDALRPGRGRLHSRRGRAGRHPGHALHGLFLGTDRRDRRPDWLSVVHGNRTGDHGARRSLVRAPAGNHHSLAP